MSGDGSSGWGAFGRQLGERLGKLAEERGPAVARWWEAGKDYAPPDVRRSVERGIALVALGFSPFDEPDDAAIEAAWKSIARECHPDRTPDPQAHARFKAARAALDELRPR